MKINVASILTFFCAVFLIGISGSAAFGQDVNLALKSTNPKITAAQSSANTWDFRIAGPPVKAIDGMLTGGLSNQEIVETNNENAWFEVDLGGYYNINKIVIHPRSDNCCTAGFKPILIVTDQPINPARTDDEKVRATNSIKVTDPPFGVAMTDDAQIKSSSNFYKFFEADITSPVTVLVPAGQNVGRYVRLQMKGSNKIELAEIEIFGNSAAKANYTPDAGNAWNSTAANSNASNSGNTSTPTTPTSTGSTSGATPTSGGTSPDELPANPNNLARMAGVLPKLSNGGGPGAEAGNAIDGKLQNRAESQIGASDSWFEVDLGKSFKINKVIIHPRFDCCGNIFQTGYLIVTNEKIDSAPTLDAAKMGNSSTFFTTFNTGFKNKDNPNLEIPTNGGTGQYVRLQLKGWGAIELSEIQIIGDPNSGVAYTSNPAKAWNASFVAPFDPNYPNYRGETGGGYFDTLQSSPKIIGVENSDNTFDIAFQDNFAASKLIRVNTYSISGTTANKIPNKTLNLPGLGVFAGFAKGSLGDRYIFTATPWTDYEKEVPAKVYKNSEVLWDAQYFNMFGDKTITTGVRALMNGFKEGTSRMVVGKTADNKESLLITTNIQPTHPYQVILSTDGFAANSERAFFESMWQHNFGQRAIFDGKDFVIMENRDHDVSVTLSKLKPTEVLPLVNPNLFINKTVPPSEQQQKNEAHANEMIRRVFSVYSHTNSNNYTYTELGSVEKGFNDDAGYLVLFAGERDWDNKMKGGDEKREMPNSRRAPEILSPRDLGLIHVKNDFNTGDVNFMGKIVEKKYIENGQEVIRREVVRMETTPVEKSYIAPVQCPQTVDNSKLVNSTGATTTVAYDTADDGWYWPDYAKGSKCENMGVRTLVNKGVKWVTDYGRKYQADKKVAIANESTKPEADKDNEFTSVAHPKLVRLTQNKYIALWEEYKADYVKFPNGNFGRPLKKYVTTKAALITLSPAANGEVMITAGNAVDLNLQKKAGDIDIRLMPGDDAFEFDGKAAWAVGNTMKDKLRLYTVDASLKLTPFDLEL